MIPIVFWNIPPGRTEQVQLQYAADDSAMLSGWLSFPGLWWQQGLKLLLLIG